MWSSAQLENSGDSYQMISREQRNRITLRQRIFEKQKLRQESNNNFLKCIFFPIRSFTYSSSTHIHPWLLQYFSSSIANKSRSVPQYLHCRWIFSNGWNLKICNLQIRSKTFKTYQHPVNSSLKLCFNSVHLCILNKLSVYKNCLIPIHTRALVFWCLWKPTETHSGWSLTQSWLQL